ncbi:unnamed protein product [Caenorhabditis auriculariae]|uniref:Uncharacterized protein n=1 Tax=Caenorhabditis auriculariae TaxID=2777116 RepID=A0A8S1GSP9_9PELO|nr:unnamed protein product [Caenorhabditis auriculariae]
MVKFAVEKKTKLGRLGKVEEWGDVPLSHATPSYMTYLRGGHIPHLTWDVAEKRLSLSQTPIYQLTLPSLVNMAEVIKKFGKGAPKFCGMPKGSAVHLAVHDPLKDYPSGYNTTKSVAIWTKNGKCSESVMEFWEEGSTTLKNILAQSS